MKRPRRWVSACARATCRHPLRVYRSDANPERSTESHSAARPGCTAAAVHRRTTGPGAGGRRSAHAGLLFQRLLGLAADPRLAEALTRGAARYGTGSGAAHLISGQPGASRLEEELAAFTGRQRALLFRPATWPILGVISALLGRGDSLFEDRLNHASLIDGGLLARARLRRYAHADVGCAGSGSSMVPRDAGWSRPMACSAWTGMSRRWPTGRPPHRARAWLMVDDAHGIGVLGLQGRAALPPRAGPDQVPILMATLARRWAPPGIRRRQRGADRDADPAGTSVHLHDGDAAGDRRGRKGGPAYRRRRGMAARTPVRPGAAPASRAQRIGLELMPSQTPIQPLLLGDSDRATRWSGRCSARGSWSVRSVRRRCPRVWRACGSPFRRHYTAAAGRCAA